MSLKLTKIKQTEKDKKINDITGAVENEMLSARLKVKGKRVALAIGSRGINNLKLVVKSTVETIKKMGGDPFIVPAMGSHGGADAFGQKEVLHSLGVSEKEVGAPIFSSMEVVELSNDGLENSVFMDKYAHCSDGVILINRIKPHTDFHGPYESGLVKMSVLGLGNHKQALEIHRFGTRGLRELMPKTAERIIVGSGKIILGLAIIEDNKDDTILIKALNPSTILTEEPALLEFARANMPTLPVPEIDILIVKQMGKNLSGTGIDPNVIGRYRATGTEEPETPKIKSIVVTDLTSESHGNAIGVGLADVVTQKLYDKIDFKATYENVITTTFLERGKIPIVAKTSMDAYEIAKRSLCDFGHLRVVYIKDTLNLKEMYVSNAILKDIEKPYEIMGTESLVFDDSGELII